MIKPILTVLVATSLALGMVACQSTGKAEAKQETATQSTAANQPAATPAQRTQPQWQEKAKSMAPTTVEWASKEFNYGSVPTGTTVTHQFRFTNTGSEPLTMTRVKASCGCTTPSYSKEPIAPGEEGFIDVAFNTTGKSGIQNKSVTVSGNFEDKITQILRITGEVTAAPAQ
jgi:hypothetical protein